MWNMHMEETSASVVKKFLTSYNFFSRINIARYAEYVLKLQVAELITSIRLGFVEKSSSGSERTLTLIHAASTQLIRHTFIHAHGEIRWQAGEKAKVAS